MGAGWRCWTPWLVALASCASCSGASAGEGMRLLEFRQRDFEDVALNEELAFYFSEDLDLGSVTSDSVRIVDELGREVAGERRVRKNQLTFLPELPRASDLSDGGLLPGSACRVVLGGFPRPDGLRGESGALLSATLLLSFRTARIGGTRPLFLDPSAISGSSPLRPRGTPLSDHFVLEEGRIVLECTEALDPTSVPHCRFELSRYPAGAKDGEPEQVPLRVRLVENRRERAELLLEPAEPGREGEPLASDTYYLRMPGRELRTLGGRQIEPLWRRDLLKLVVPPRRVELDFTSTQLRSSEPPPGCAGTAQWGGAGPGLRVRYPAAAGTGEAGAVELLERPDSADLHATRLSVPPGVEVNLSGFEGAVVLRSQTSLEVRGSLIRHGAREANQDPLSKALENLKDRPGKTLSEWVGELLDPAGTASKLPWTVLIAGGDIRVPRGGRIATDGPLVLVAGGWIRVEGTAYSDSSLWRTNEGGGMSARRVEALLLVLDPPKTNPLRVPLVAGALASSARRGRDWRTVLVSRGGKGRIVTELLGAAGEPLRLLVRLEVEPGEGEPWDPPWLERLVLESRADGEGGEAAAR